jgi:hypothetical protein
LFDQHQSVQAFQDFRSISVVNAMLWFRKKGKVRPQQRIQGFDHEDQIEGEYAAEPGTGG